MNYIIIIKINDKTYYFYYLSILNNGYKYITKSRKKI